MNDFRSEMEKVLGFYSFRTGATIVNPFYTENSYPQITEIHEGYHRDLAHTTTTGLLTKFLMVLTKPGLASLPSALETKVYAALESLLVNTRVVHESVANYLSLGVFYALSPEDADRFVDKLTPSYKQTMFLLEDVFGPVSENVEYRLAIERLVYEIARVALCPPCFPIARDLKTLELLPSYISTHSPNLRFSNILQALHNSGELQVLQDYTVKLMDEQMEYEWRYRVDTHGAFTNEIPIQDVQRVSSILGNVSQKLLRKIAESNSASMIKSEPDHDVIRDDAKELLAAWKEQSYALGIAWLNEIEFRNLGDRSWRHAFNVRYSVLAANEEISEGALNDASAQLYATSRTEGEVERILDICHDFGSWVFLRVMFNNLDVIGILPCIVAGYSWSTRSDFLFAHKDSLSDREWWKSFTVITDLFFLRQLLRQPRRDNVAIKVDERPMSIPHLEGVLRSFGQPLFITCSDTSLENILVIIDRELERCGHVYVYASSLGKQGSAVLLIGNKVDKQIWSMPLPILAWNFLVNDRFGGRKNVQVLNELQLEADPLDIISCNRELFLAFLTSTYCLPMLDL